MKRSFVNPDSHEASKLQKVNHEIERQLVRLHEIPQYLHSSYFYQSLCIDDAGEISIPAKHMKLDLSLSSLSDLVELLNTIRFWILETILPELVFFLLFTVDVDCTMILENYSTELQYLSVYLCVLETKHGMVLIRTMLKNGWTVSTEGLKRAVRNNKMHCVRYALNVMLNDMGMNCRLVRFRDFWGRQVIEHFTESQGCNGPRLYEGDTMRFANNGFDWCRFALQQGAASCLALFHERCHNCTWKKDKKACMIAIQKGHFACAQYCMQHGGDFNLVDCALMVGNPRLGLLPPDQAEKMTAEQNECLHFLLERCGSQAVALDVTTVVLKQGNIVALRKIIEQGWPVDCTVAEQAARDNDILTLQVYCAAGHFLPSTICSTAAERGHLAVLQLAHQQGSTWDAKVCAVAAQNGHMKCLQYAQQHQRRLDKSDHTY